MRASHQSPGTSSLTSENDIDVVILAKNKIIDFSNNVVFVVDYRF